MRMIDAAGGFGCGVEAGRADDEARVFDGFGVDRDSRIRRVRTIAAEDRRLAMEQRHLLPGASLEAGMETLSRTVHALIDGDLVLPADGRELLETLEAACRSLEAGDTPAAHAHLARLLDALRTLPEGDRVRGDDPRLAVVVTLGLLTALAG